MGKSFVYNTGSSEDSIGQDELEPFFGLFFDGTLNNRLNTELRKKYRNEDDTTALTPEKKTADLKREQEDYETVTNGSGLIPIPEGIDSLEFKPEEYKAYLLGIHRTDADLRGTDNSYSNDYSNVARMWKCCEQKKYGIYIEGIGTENEKRDADDGFAFGADVTGIRGKVRKGCEELAKRISKILKNNTKKTATEITVDVFGFSRGAAAARNFVYEVNNVKKPYKPTPKQVVDGYKYPTNQFSKGGPTPIYKTAYCDSDGIAIDSSLLINGKMPKMGHLGYSLLKKGIKPEQLETLELRVRFLGVYDTVSSYAETGDLEAYDFGLKLIKEPFLSGFKNDVEELNLNNLGRLAKAVHFTAKDEHRENFDLTRLKIGIEKNFPGVHCDIGGAYENEIEVIDEIEVVNKHPGVGFNSYSSWNPYKELEEFRKKLIKDYWYQEEELVIGKEKYWGGILQYTKLTGTRAIRKEYSYIPLHFMRKLCLPYMEEHMTKSVVDEYSINHDELLVSAKKYLHEYVFGDAKEWNFISDEEIDKLSKEREKAKEMQELFANQTPFGQRVNENIDLSGPRIRKEENEPTSSFTMEEVVIYGGRQGVLRKLRHQYFHWSATRDWMGMDPNNDRKREEH
jgi:hypothetical protein